MFCPISQDGNTKYYLKVSIRRADYHVTFNSVNLLRLIGMISEGSAYKHIRQELG